MCDIALAPGGVHARVSFQEVDVLAVTAIIRRHEDLHRVDSRVGQEVHLPVHPPLVRAGLRFARQRGNGPRVRLEHDVVLDEVFDLVDDLLIGLVFRFVWTAEIADEVDLRVPDDDAVEALPDDRRCHKARL